MVVPSENFDGKLFKNAAASHFFQISLLQVSVPPAV